MIYFFEGIQKTVEKGSGQKEYYLPFCVEALWSQKRKSIQCQHGKRLFCLLQNEHYAYENIILKGEFHERIDFEQQETFDCR
jgi:hypothetical protein